MVKLKINDKKMLKKIAQKQKKNIFAKLFRQNMRYTQVNQF
jgi:hypothetical protein